MFLKLAFGLSLGVLATGCFSLTPPVSELHTQAANDFGCPPKTGLIDTRTEAKPVTLGNTQRMSIQGCGQKAIYHYDSHNKVWVREPDVTTTSATTAK
jgi:hypothetical protein